VRSARRNGVEAAGSLAQNLTARAGEAYAVVDGFSFGLSESWRSCQAFLRDDAVRMKP
jgi:hypothetical protein